LESSAASQSAMRNIFLLLALAIVYGSLYPFDFAMSAATDSRVSALWGAHWSSSRGDILSNIGLFAPLGLIAAMAKPHWRWIGMLIAAFIFAHIIQVFQIWLPARDPSLLDTLLNVLGFLGGLFSYGLLHEKIGQLRFGKRIELHILIVVLAWPLAFMLPLVPTLDFQNIKNVIKDLVQAQSMSVPIILFHACGWFGFSAILSRFASLQKPWLALVLFCISMGAQPFLVQGNINQSQVIGGLLGLGLGFLFKTQSASRKSLFPAFLLTLALLVEGLWPGSNTNSSFNFLPLHSYLDGNLLANSRSIMRRLYFAAVLLLLWQGQSTNFITGIFVATILAAFILLGRLAFDLDRTCDLIDLMWPILASMTLAALKSTPPATAEKTKPIATAIPSKPLVSSTRTSTALKLIGLTAAVALAIYNVIKIAGVSYNVREIFAGGTSFISCILLAAALVILGSTSAIVTARVKQRGRRLLWYPISLCLGILFGYWLLQNAVSSESLYDILGSPVIFRDTADHNSLVRSAGLYLSNNIELGVRFIALTLPLFLWLTIWLLLLQFERGRHAMLTGLLAIAIAIPFFILARLITIEGTGTDNIIELIEPGRGFLLFIFLALLALVAAQAATVKRHSAASWAKASGVLVFGAIAGWMLLRYGLVQHLQKYGLSYSGVQFLFGPDRTTPLPESILFIRWCIAYAGIIAGLALASRWSMQLVTPFKPHSPNLA
jgi:VanZ family protein